MAASNAWGHGAPNSCLLHPFDSCPTACNPHRKAGCNLLTRCLSVPALQKDNLDCTLSALFQLGNTDMLRGGALLMV